MRSWRCVPALFLANVCVGLPSNIWGFNQDILLGSPRDIWDNLNSKKIEMWIYWRMHEIPLYDFESIFILMRNLNYFSWDFFSCLHAILWNRNYSYTIRWVIWIQLRWNWPLLTISLSSPECDFYINRILCEIILFNFQSRRGLCVEILKLKIKRAPSIQHVAEWC